MFLYRFAHSKPSGAKSALETTFGAGINALRTSL